MDDVSLVGLSAMRRKAVVSWDMQHVFGVGVITLPVLVQVPSSLNKASYVPGT